MVRIHKALRKLTVLSPQGAVLWEAPIALGPEPVGPKQAEGDGRTPEGTYAICLVKPQGRHGQSLGLSYPGPADAELALVQGRIDSGTLQAILTAHREGCRPPWGSPLGGEIYIHAGGTQADWTQGCIALEAEDMARLFALADQIQEVKILP